MGFTAYLRCSAADPFGSEAGMTDVGFSDLHDKIAQIVFRGKEQRNILQPIESTKYCFYRRQLDARVYSCAPSCFAVSGADADVGDGTGFHTTTQCLLTVVTDLKGRNASGLQRTNKCCNRSVAC